MEEIRENSVETGEKLDTRFKKGDDPRRNLNGRPKGSRDFATDFDEVVAEIEKENGMNRSEARKLLLKVAFKNAKEGDFPFWRDIHDRLYGKPIQPIAGGMNGEPIKIVFDEAFKNAINPETEINS